MWDRTPYTGVGYVGRNTLIAHLVNGFSPPTQMLSYFFSSLPPVLASKLMRLGTGGFSSAQMDLIGCLVRALTLIPNTRFPLSCLSCRDRFSQFL
jgi:hypothetical protein